MPLKNKLTFAYVLSGVLAIVLLISSIVGLLYGRGGFYDSYPASLAGLVGQDWVTLVVGIPLLVVSMWLTGRGSTGGLLVWAGTLFYFAYSYYFYVIGGFNALFLIYIAIVSTSLYGLLSLLFAIDAEALRARFGARAPTRLVGGFFIGISLLFALMWGGMIVTSAVAGTRPGSASGIWEPKPGVGAPRRALRLAATHAMAAGPSTTIRYHRTPACHPRMGPCNL